MMTEQLATDTLAPIAAILKALADPNRLRIFNVLMQGDTYNCELSQQLGLPPNLLSHHLRVLHQAGLVYNQRDEADARWIYYTVNTTTVTQWRAWLYGFLDPVRIHGRLTLYRPEMMNCHNLAQLAIEAEEATP